MEDYGWEKKSIKGIAFFVGEDHDPIGFWATVFLDKSVRVNIMNIRKKKSTAFNVLNASCRVSGTEFLTHICIFGWKK